MTKKTARNLALTYRENINNVQRTIKSKIIVNKIINDDNYKTAKLIGVYYPFGSEVDILELTHSSALFAYPKIINDKMEFILVSNKTKWIKSSFGVLEPHKGKIVSSKIDLLLISSLCSNRNNFRLGYGKGYYDDFIKRYRPKHNIGILFDNYQIEFNADPWDIALDYYISN